MCSTDTAITDSHIDVGSHPSPKQYRHGNNSHTHEPDVHPSLIEYRHGYDRQSHTKDKLTNTDTAMLITHTDTLTNTDTAMTDRQTDRQTHGHAHNTDTTMIVTQTDTLTIQTRL